MLLYVMYCKGNISFIPKAEINIILLDNLAHIYSILSLIGMLLAPPIELDKYEYRKERGLKSFENESFLKIC